MSVETLTDQEKMTRWQQDAIDAANQGRDPDPTLAPGYIPPAPNGEGSSPEVDSTSASGGGAFTSSDLTGEDVKNCRRFPMPKGKHLFVFPLSQSEQRTLAFWTRKINVKIESEDSQTVRASKIQQVERELAGYQAILCCYQDEDRKKRCFTDDDAETLIRTLRGLRVERIKQISDELSGEGIDLGFGDLQSFFVRGQGCLSDWLSASAGWDDCPVDLIIRTRALISPSQV